MNATSTTTNSGFGGIVAGVSTTDGRAVVRWAAEEAATHDAGLRLVTAFPAPTVLDRRVPHATASRVLAELAGEVATGWPGVAVTTGLSAGPPAAVLRAAAEHANLLVVGADNAGPFTEAIRGSVPGDLLTTAPCLLAVVPRRGWTTPASAPVVVALDESAISHAALAYGYATTARTGQRLRILRCASTGSDGGTAGVRLLIMFEELYPDVVVSTEVVHGDPRHALVAASRHAALLVLGARGQGRLASGLFGSVSRHLIRGSACPVVVTRTHPAQPRYAETLSENMHSMVD
jgi:nucleotide-binding universal stress UspA family protein